MRSSLPLRLAERLLRRDLAGVLERGLLAMGALGQLLAEDLAEGIAAAGFPPLGKGDLFLPGDRRQP